MQLEILAAGANRANSQCKCGSRGLGTGKHLSLLPALLLVLLPKCPLCLMAWFGVFGSVGSAWISAAWGTPIAVALLSMTVACLMWRSRSAQPLLLGGTGCVMVLAGKCFVDQPVLLYLGLTMLLAASFGCSRFLGARQE